MEGRGGERWGEAYERGGIGRTSVTKPVHHLIPRGLALKRHEAGKIGLGGGGGELTQATGNMRYHTNIDLDARSRAESGRGL